MIKAIKTMFWVCVIAGLALVVRVTTTVKNNDIFREVFTCEDGQCYEVSVNLDGTIADGIKNVLEYNPDAVVVSETRYYENGDILRWTANGEGRKFQYIWNAPLIGGIKWHWSTVGAGGEVPLREL